MIDNKDIKRIELTYEGHCCIDLEQIFPKLKENPFAEGKVKQWWVKWGTLYMELHDGSEVERDISSDVADAYDNLDTKWPTSINVEDEEGGWHRRETP